MPLSGEGLKLFLLFIRNNPNYMKMRLAVVSKTKVAKSDYLSDIVPHINGITKTAVITKFICSNAISVKTL